MARAAVTLGGGGHSQAAGFTTDEAVPDVLVRLRALLWPASLVDGLGERVRALLPRRWGLR